LSDQINEIAEAAMKIISGFALLLILISSASAEDYVAAPPPGNWNKVNTLPINTNIVVELRNGIEINGKFVRSTEDSILVMEYEREKAYPKHAVARIQCMRAGSRTRNAAIAGGVFFGLGFGLGYAAAPNITDQNHPPSGERLKVAAGFGGFLGGAAAAISLAHRPAPRSEVIYKAR
jgi:hypothetical protein